LLSWVCIFLLGYLYSGLMNHWQQQLLEEGAVARYGLLKVMKFGLEENLEKVRTTLVELTDKLHKLPESTEGLAEDKKKETANQRQQIVDGFSQCSNYLAKLET